MSAFGAHCVDRVFPAAPVRQWVLTVPIALRFRMGARPVLTGQVLAIAVRVVSSWLRRQARSNRVRGGILKTGAVTVIQRFDSALGLNVHFHMLFVDGVFRRVAAERFLVICAPRPTGSTSTRPRPTELLEKLIPLISRPRTHTTRY